MVDTRSELLLSRYAGDVLTRGGRSGGLWFKAASACGTHTLYVASTSISPTKHTLFPHVLTTVELGPCRSNSSADDLSLSSFSSPPLHHPPSISCLSAACAEDAAFVSSQWLLQWLGSHPPVSQVKQLATLRNSAVSFTSMSLLLSRDSVKITKKPRLSLD